MSFKDPIRWLRIPMLGVKGTGSKVRFLLLGLGVLMLLVGFRTRVLGLRVIIVANKGLLILCKRSNPVLQARHGCQESTTRSRVRIALGMLVPRSRRFDGSEYREHPLSK